MNQFLRIYPQSLFERNYGGDLPIHIACRQGAGKDIIKIMLEKGVGTSKETDCEGRLPLHLAACSSDIHLNSIQDLITYNEKAARTPDDFGLLPLHWACTKNATAGSVETIIKIYPYAIEHKDVYGKLPMDRLEKSSNPEKARIVELLSRDVSSWSSAMLSTIVELSSKIAAAEKMKEESKEKERECKVLMDQNTRSFNEINALVEKIHDMQDQFVHKVRTLKRAHAVDLQQQKQQYEEETMVLGSEKDFAEKKSQDLKILVDELVEQLKIQKSLVDEKEVSRVELKKKAMELLSKIEGTQKEIEMRSEDTENLKMYQVKLKYEIEKRDQHIENLTERRDSYDIYSERDSRLAYDDHRRGKFDSDIPKTFECVRINEDESY